MRHKHLRYGTTVMPFVSAKVLMRYLHACFPGINFGPLARCRGAIKYYSAR